MTNLINIFSSNELKIYQSHDVNAYNKDNDHTLVLRYIKNLNFWILEIKLGEIPTSCGIRLIAYFMGLLRMHPEICREFTSVLYYFKFDNQFIDVIISRIRKFV